MSIGELVGSELSGNIQAVAALPREVAILKMEHDTIASMAVARPRDFKTIARDMREQFELFPAFAKAAIYSKPVGDNKIARNLSVRAAEAIAEAYGYCRIKTNVELIKDQPDLVRVEASFVDYQKGKIWEDSAIVSKWYKARSGKMTKIPGDRFFGVTVRAAQSKVIREVILRSVAPGLRLEIFDQAEKALGALLTDDEVKKIISAFSQFNVTEEMIESFIGRAMSVGWTEEDRLNLLGAYNAIKDGDATVDAVFNQKDGESGSAPESDDLPESSVPSGVTDFVNKAKDKPVATKPVEQKPAATTQQSKPNAGPAKPVSAKPSGPKGYMDLIAAASSESQCHDIGVMVQKDAALKDGEKRALTGRLQSKIASLMRSAPVQEQVKAESELYLSYRSRIEKCDPSDEDSVQSINVDLLEDEGLASDEREMLLGLLSAKTGQ